MGFTCDHHIRTRHLSKLTMEQGLLQFILYIWNMIMFPCTMHLYGIHQRVQFVMMPSSLHPTLMMQLEMKFNGPQHRNRLCWAQIWRNSKVALHSLMACSSRFTKLGMMGPTRFGSMGERRFTQSTTPWLLIIEVYSFTWTLGI